MMQAIGRASICAAALAALAACASPITVGEDHDARADFSGWRTWADPAPAASDSITDQRVRSAVTRVLTGRGYGRAPAESADFLVSWTTNTHRQREVFQTMDDPYSGFGYRAGSGLGGTTQVIEYDVGTLVIELADRRAGVVSWRGHASGTVDESADPAERDARILEGVTKMLAQFPPKGR